MGEAWWPRCSAVQMGWETAHVRLPLRVAPTRPVVSQAEDSDECQVGLPGKGRVPGQDLSWLPAMARSRLRQGSRWWLSSPWDPGDPHGTGRSQPHYL